MLNASDAMKTCKNMKKMIKTQVLETLKWKCKRERLEKRGHHEFLYWFTQTWATSSLSRQPELNFALFQKIYKVSTLTLSKYAKTPQKTLESHKNHTNTARTLLQTWKTTKHTHKAWERSNLSGSTTLPTTNHFLQASNQAKSSKNWSKINLQQLQHLWSWRREFPQVSRTNSCSKMINLPLFRKSQLL